MQAIAEALNLLELHADYRVLRRFVARGGYSVLTSEPKIGLYVDVETTGTNTDEDKIIQFAAVRFQFDAEGNIGDILSTFVQFEDPGEDLSPEIVALTGITDDQLHGQRISDSKVREYIAGVDLVIAHNAEFDRKMIERRLQGFDTLPWGCSMREVAWDKFGCTGSKLDYLLVMLCWEFHQAHSAVQDCFAGIHLLATPAIDGVTPFHMLLQSVRTPTYRLFANSAPFTTKEKLKARKYRWYPDPIGAWALDLKKTEIEAEQAWLQEHVYTPGRINHSEAKRISARDRYSVRAS